MMALVTVETERMAAEGRAVMTAVAAVVVGVTSKHVSFRSCFVISNLQIYRIARRSRAFSIYLKPIETRYG